MKTTGIQLVRVFLVTVLVAMLPQNTICRAEVETSGAATSDSEEDGRRATAIALNYCNASFHRIKRYQSKRVLLEERDKILDNLNLNGIVDQDVIKLYSEVLDEVSQIEIADRETEVLQDKFKKAMSRQVSSTVFVVAAQMATASLDGMVRTGVNSWLDYRDQRWAREFDAWKVEKARMNAVVSKSSRFLDTGWKLARQKKIPDRWLVRSSDLDALSEAVQEPDLEKRQRILKRMAPFMECYPPYWYYVARTEQGLGRLIEASSTYARLAELGRGHFRRDEMLAASLANRAVIQAHLRQPGAEQTAREALRYSADVWEANLMCAQVLESYGRSDAAEDAILRNLDVDLERTRSSVALVGLYYRGKQFAKLGAALADTEMLETLPVLSIAQCAARLGPERTPGAALHQIRNSLKVAVEPRFGADDVLVMCGSNWQPELASVRFIPSGLSEQNASGTRPVLGRHSSGEAVLRFPRAITSSGLAKRNTSPLFGSMIVFDYSREGIRAEPIRIVFGSPVTPSVGSSAAAPWWTAASPAEVRFGATRVSLINPLQRQTGTETKVASQQPPGKSDLRVRSPSSTPPAISISPRNRVSRSSQATAPSGPSRERGPRITIVGVRAASESTRDDENVDRDDARIVPPPPE